MNKTYNILMVVFATLTLISCKLDNYDGPDSSIYGSILDEKDGTLVQQDIARGTQICYQELGFNNPETQYMLIKETGEYRNNLMFTGEYDIFFNESNFVIPEKLVGHTIKKGENQLDFRVQPYIRISDIDIAKTGDEIVATFTITPTVDNKVKTIGLFGHIDRVVSNSYALDRKTQNIDTSSKDTPLTYTLRLSTGNFKAGTHYYFRVGGVVEGAGTKYNYATAVRIKL